MSSVLTSIKKMLGVEDNATYFDDALVVFINTAFLNLKQLGIGPEAGFSITGSTELWSTFSTNAVLVESAKTYVYLKTKTLFDPSASSSIQGSIETVLAELEWRMLAEKELADYEEENSADDEEEDSDDEEENSDEDE